MFGSWGWRISEVRALRFSDPVKKESSTRSVGGEGE